MGACGMPPYLSCQSTGYGDINCFRPFAAPVRLSVKGNLLSVVKSRKAGSLNSRNMHKDIRATIVRLDKTKTFLIVEKLNFTRLSHIFFPS